MDELLEKFAGRPVIPGVVGIAQDHAAYTDPSSDIFESGVTGTRPQTTFIVSEESEDRDGDIVRSSNWDIADWQRAGALWLFDHGESCSLPIGSSINPDTGELAFWQENGKTYATIFHDVDRAWGREVCSYVKDGLLKTASIGFLPKDKVSLRKGHQFHGGGDKGPWDIQSLNLVELTITPTSSNPNAMAVRLSAGHVSPMMRKSLTKTLGVMADTAGGVLVEPEHKEDDPGEAIHKDIQDCVSRKIEKFMDEGMEQDRAIAAAYHFCGEEKAAKLREGETMPEIVEKNGRAPKKKAVDVDELQDSPVAEDAGSVILPGHKILANVCEHIKALIDWLKDERGSLQHEDIADYVDSELTEVLEELHESARAKGSEHYPESEAFQSDGEDESPEGVGDEDEFGEIEKSETDNEDFPESEEEGDESDKEGKKSKTPNEATEDDADAAVNGRTTEEVNPRDADAGNEYAEGIPEGEQAERADEYTSQLARPKKRKRLEEYRKKFYARKGYRMSKAAASVCMKACGQMDDSAEHLEKSAESDETPAEHGYMHKGHAAMLRKHAGEVRKAIGVGTESNEGEAEYDAKGENASPGAESEMGEREWDKHLPSILGALETIGQKATKLDNTVKRIQGK